MTDALSELRNTLGFRFSDAPPVAGEFAGLETLARLAGRGSQRHFTEAPVDADLLRLLAAVALAAPTKSDLQQRDIVCIADPALRRAINGLVAEQAWVEKAPALLVFCGNNQRQRLIHDWRGRRFVNDHLDAFFNAAVDAAIALGAFVSAAEAAIMATTSGSFSISCDSTVQTTWVSCLKPGTNSGRIGRSISREVRVSFSVGRASRLKKPPGILPAA